MADQLFKYSFRLKTTTAQGTKMKMEGGVYDVDGHPSSAFDKVRETCAKSVGPPELYTHADIVLLKSVKPIRRIKIIREPTGLEGVEACFFCKQPTRYWNKKRNLPVCDSCATTHTPDELPDVAVKK